MFHKGFFYDSCHIFLTVLIRMFHKGFFWKVFPLNFSRVLSLMQPLSCNFEGLESGVASGLLRPSKQLGCTY